MAIVSKLSLEMVLSLPAPIMPVGGEDTLPFLSCGTCLPSWEINYVPIDRPPWSVVSRVRDDRFWPAPRKLIQVES